MKCLELYGSPLFHDRLLTSHNIVASLLLGRNALDVLI